jgi:RNA polymerase sigma-70 factor (ECF subfamily)
VFATPEDLERLYYERFVGLKRSLATLTRDYGTAEEALQEAFVRALASLESYRGECPLAAWVWRIAVRVALEQGRSQRRRSRREEASCTEPEPQLVEAGHDPRLVGALRGLSPQRRMIVFLRYFADCSYAEIAAICEISEGTVAASLSQSKTLLAERLGVVAASPNEEVTG